MPGSLALANGLLYVGCEEKTARVRVFDLDGHVVEQGFTFRDERLGRSVAAGIAVDEDHRLWVADTPASRVRCFTLFGREDAGLGLSLDAPLTRVEATTAAIDGPDGRGIVRAPVDVAVEGNGEEGQIVVALDGERRHGVQVFDVERGYVHSPRPCGDPHGRFRGVRGVALRGRGLYVAEARGARVQVFRDGAFHFAFSIPLGGDARFEPVSVAPLSDGRLVVACSGPPSAVLLVDAAGRLLRVLAEEGSDEGQVSYPADVVVEEGESDGASRIAVIDRDGERVQVFTVEGRCYGAFAERA